MLILLVFKKYKKSKFIEKERKLRDQFWGPNNILPINIGPQLRIQGGILNIWRRQLEKKNLKKLNSQPKHPPPPSSKSFFSFPSFQSPLTITSHSPLPSAQRKPTAQVPPSGCPIFSSLPGHLPPSFWKKQEDQGSHPWSPSSLSWSRLYFGWKSDIPSQHKPPFSPLNIVLIVSLSTAILPAVAEGLPSNFWNLRGYFVNFKLFNVIFV